MKKPIQARLIPEKIKEKFTLPEGVLIMRLYKLAATEWETRHKHHKPWEPFIQTCNDLMDAKFVSCGVISEFRKQIKRGDVPFLSTSLEPISKRTKRTASCYTFNKAAFDVFCGLPAHPLKPVGLEQQRKGGSPTGYPENPNLPELITYKEMQRMVRKGRLFNKLKILVKFFGVRLTGELSHTAALYDRKDVERLIRRSQELCRTIGLPQQFPSTTETNGTEGE